MRGSHSQVGLVGAASCTDYLNGTIKKHEFTRPDKEDDRVRHIETLNSQTGPVFLVYRSTNSLDGLVSQSTSASVIFVATIVGAPVSTTQVVSSSVVGIGVGRSRWRHISWQIVRNIALAWVTTMPAAGLIAALSLPIWKLLPGG